MKSPFTAKVTAVATALVVLILVLVPFHAFLSVWAASIFGHYGAARLWEEVLLAVLVPLSCWLLWRDKPLRAMAAQSWLFWLMGAYVAVHILLGGIAVLRHQVDALALGYALIENLRLVMFFSVAWVVASQSGWLRERWRHLLLVPAGIVVGFGLLQAFALPHDFLRHFGYGPTTIAPYETVDQKAQYVRVQSTMRGANPLGAYLVVIVAAATVFCARKKRIGWRTASMAVLGVATLAVLYFTYSRSAYIGAAVALAAVVWLLVRGRRAKQWLLVGAAGLVLAGAGATLALRHNDRFENTFFHTDEHSHSLNSSNQKRSSALAAGVHDVVRQPLGNGPGSAGPASVHNDHPARLAENYYLQIGQEVGWLGLVIFILINVLVAWQLWQRRAESLPVVLLASLVGITCVNMLSHAWTDDTLAYIWWGFAGIACARRISSAR